MAKNNEIETGAGSPEKGYDEKATFSSGIENALDGYAKDGGTWTHAKEVFDGWIEEGYRVDDALNLALAAGQDGAESTPQEAAKRFWDKLPTETAVRGALNGYAHSKGKWTLGRWTFEDMMEQGEPVDRALGEALAVTSEDAESTPAMATLRFWEKIQPSYVKEWMDRPMNHVDDGIILGVRIHVPSDKVEGAGTYMGDQDGQSVIVKHGAKKHLEREREILTKVDHKGLPRVTSYSEDVEIIDGLTRMAMEHLPGQSLDKRLKGEKSPPLRTKSVVGISLGLIDDYQALSDAGYIYRDLNPAHVIVDRKGDEISSVGLVDVESCLEKSEDGTAEVARPRGTWETMAPEEFYKGGVMTEASSVYSIGSLMLHMATGERPFVVPPGDTEEEIKRLYDLTHDLHQQLPNIPVKGRLGEVLKKALDPDPVKRFQSLKELRAAVQSVQ